jgi:hypothetical protein
MANNYFYWINSRRLRAGRPGNWQWSTGVPALYAIFILDLKLIKWRERPATATSPYNSPSAVTQPLKPLS